MRAHNVPMALVLFCPYLPTPLCPAPKRRRDGFKGESWSGSTTCLEKHSGTVCGVEDGQTIQPAGESAVQR